MEPAVLALEEKYEERIEFIIADVTTPEGNSLAGKYGVNLIPAFFVLDSKGNTVFSEVGALSAEILDSEISKVAGTQ